MPVEITESQALAQLIADARGFYEKNWMLGTSGNLSIRIHGESRPEAQPLYVITGSGLDKGALTPDDFVRCGPGGIVQAGTRGSSAETMLHDALYQTYPEVTAVYHVHTVSATLLSLHSQTFPEFSGLEMIKGLGFPTHDVTIRIPVLDNTQDIADLSRHLSPSLEPDVPGFLLKGHGLYAWGKTPFDAKRHVEIWEFLFQLKLGQAALLPGDRKWPSSLPVS